VVEEVVISDEIKEEIKAATKEEESSEVPAQKVEEPNPYTPDSKE
jgi:hypothetical protein